MRRGGGLLSRAVTAIGLAKAQPRRSNVRHGLVHDYRCAHIPHRQQGRTCKDLEGGAAAADAVASRKHTERSIHETRPDDSTCTSTTVNPRLVVQASTSTKATASKKSRRCLRPPKISPKNADFIVSDGGGGDNLPEEEGGSQPPPTPLTPLSKS